ncbi:hypothetical protein [Streptomyces sp. NRRL WC-3742]|uniref:hypothetical protein n=1 Tax=Streptomyces sp. NRRL WC-3742 TaxID=1463934 RepID=UPI0004C80797|nr:hypothetical protein [Streptomyces sp. NRRL WC-3742]
MDIVYTSLIPRQPGHHVHEPTAGAEIVDALWAHALPGDGLEHVNARPEPDRVDLLLYLRTPDSPDAPAALQRAHDLIVRSHRTSPRLNRHYLPPEPLPAPEDSSAG